MPLSVAATLNLLDVPIGAAQISLSFTPPPDRGTGSSCQAPRKALAPLPPLVWASQITPVLASVPLDVIVGDPDENPRVKELLATSVKDGLSSLAETPNLNSRMKSFRPMETM